MKRNSTYPLVLSVYPTSKGFAFVLFHTPLAPYDWGVKAVRHRDKNLHTIREVMKLIDQYRPDALVIEDTTETGTKRSSRIRRLYRKLDAEVTVEGIDVYAYGRDAVRMCFEKFEATTKHQIAVAIAGHIEAFAHRLPPKRKIWQSPDGRQSLFDAAALGLTFYAAAGTSFCE